MSDFNDFPDLSTNLQHVLWALVNKISFAKMIYIQQGQTAYYRNLCRSVEDLWRNAELKFPALAPILPGFVDSLDLLVNNAISTGAFPPVTPSARRFPVQR